MAKEYPTESKQLDWYPRPKGTEGLTPFVPKHQGRQWCGHMRYYPIPKDQ